MAHRDLEDNHFLSLSPECLTFTSLSQNTQVFYDDVNRQVFVVKDHGAGGIEVKGPDYNSSISFVLEDKGDIEAIKFSPSCAVLAIQRSKNTVEFINFANGIPTSSYSQSTKSKSCRILSFYWTDTAEIIFITQTGVELYQVYAGKAVKSLKTFNITVNWAIFQPRMSVLALSTGSAGNIIQALQIRPGSLYKFPKFEIPVESSKPVPGRLSLSERDVVLANLYGKLCLLVLQHENLPDEMSGAQIIIYTFQKEGPPQKTHILELELRGRFAISILDNLVAVHHQTSQTSLLFDICLANFRTEGTVSVHSVLVPPYSIKSYHLKESERAQELYSMNWEVFQPNIIVDGSVGFLWTLELNLEAICRMLSSRAKLVDFLLLRKNSKHNLIRVCREAVVGEFCLEKSNALGTVTMIFNKLNRAYREHFDQKIESRRVNPDDRMRSIVDQSDMYSSVFSIFDDEPKNFSDNFAVAVIFEYINSLSLHQIPVQYLIYERLINILVKSQQFFQLHQFLQYHVFTDSKPLACLLLSLQNQYPHAAQLALDMFKRLSVAHEDIVDIYLSQYNILRALRYIQLHGDIDSVSARKFLEFAMNSGDQTLFFQMFKFFEERNMRLRGSPEFAKGEQCETFVKHFYNLFGMTSALVPTVSNST